MGLSSTDWEKRTAALEALHRALADIAIAEKRVEEATAKYQKLLNDAKSESGTANAELAKKVGAYAAARRQLLRLVPELGAVDRFNLSRADEETRSAAE